MADTLVIAACLGLLVLRCCRSRTNRRAAGAALKYLRNYQIHKRWPLPWHSHGLACFSTTSARL